MDNPDTFCALPFMAVDRHFDKYRPCCMYQSRHWPIFDNLDHYWHSPQLEKLRLDLAGGKKDPGCQSCWKLEEQGHVSMRQSVGSSRFSLGDIQSPRLLQVKLITGKTCNLSCMMCFDTVSSSYENVWKNQPTWIMPENRRRELVYDHDMDRYIRSHADQLEYIEALGGEPLFSKDFLALVQHLVDIGASQHITLFVITNGTILTNHQIEMFLKFKKTVFAVSIDGVGAVNDYQRWGSKWTEIEQNIARIQDRFDMSVMPTVTALNIARLHELYDYCGQKHIVINNFIMVKDWPQLLPINLPDQIKSRIDPRFRSLSDGAGDPKQLIDFIQQWDRQRGISIVDHMPEWQGLI